MRSSARPLQRRATGRPASEEERRWLCATRVVPTLLLRSTRSDHTMNEEIDPRVWRRVYVATLAYGVLTIAVLWWFTSVFD